MINALQKITTKLNASKVHMLMAEFTAAVSRYPVAHIDCKSPKREAAVLKACEPIFPYQTVFTTPTNDYANSVVLIMNDIAVPFMAREVATFIYHLERFQNAIKQANNTQELQAYYKQFTLKPKQLIDALVEDVKRYAECCGFEMDIKTLIETCKEHKLTLESKTR
jgi:hypothetical protein